MSSNGQQEIILVDVDNQAVGHSEKMQAHREGLLHRAFSVFVFDDSGRLMLQQRAAGKYHSGGLWANTCCSHPPPGRDLIEFAEQRLTEEMGFSCALEPVFQFTYRAVVDNGLIEHEVDHVLFGSFERDPLPDPDEVSNWRWISLQALETELSHRPELYACWLHHCFGRVAVERGLVAEGD